MTDWQRIRGFKALLHDAVEQGSRAIERVHLETAERPFVILEQIPIVGGPTKLVHGVHDLVVTTSYAGVRLVNAAVDKAAAAAIELLDDSGAA